MNNILHIILFGLFVIIPLLYFKFDLGNNKTFKNLIEIYGSLGSILIIYSIYKTNQTNYSSTINDELNSLNQLLQNITDNCTNFFINNSNMKYYYDELFNNIININESIRNKDLEEIITNDILTNIDSLINYINSYKMTNGENFQLTIMENKLKKLLGQFMKSKIFLENWNKFKISFALDWTKTYIQLYFNE
jgi:hypothetical protein